MLKAENGVIELVQQASVFVHRNGDSHTFWTIDKGENLRQELRWELLDSIYMGCFLMLCFVHIILFLLLTSTGCSNQNKNTLPPHSGFCLGSCIGNINSKHACVWQNLIWKNKNQS